MDVILSRSMKSATLTALAAGDLLGSKMILVANDIPLNEDTVLADIVPPTFTGYAMSTALTWSPPYEEVDGRMVMSGSNKTFVCTGGVPADQIYGAALVDAMAMEVLGVIPFPTPVPVTEVDDGLTVDPIVPLPGTV